MNQFKITYSNKSNQFGTGYYTNRSIVIEASNEVEAKNIFNAKKSYSDIGTQATIDSVKVVDAYETYCGSQY